MSLISNATVRITDQNGVTIFSGKLSALNIHRDAIEIGPGVLRPGDTRVDITVFNERSDVAQPSQVGACDHDWREKRYGKWCAKCGEKHERH